MKKRRNLLLLFILVFVLAFSVGCGGAGDSVPVAPPAESAPSAEPTQSTEIVIFHTNDTHGRVAGDGESIIGLDRIAAIRKSEPYSILLDAGDTLHGLPIATLSQGADIVRLMNVTGYDAMALGNHDFNYGWERLTELQAMAEFLFIASNVEKDGAPFLGDRALIEVDGVKVALLGLTTEATAHLAMPGYVEGIEFKDPVSVARDRAKLFREHGADVIIALCHLGSEPSEGTLSTDIAREVPDIDVIIDGHSHTALPEGLMENGVLIAQADPHGGSLGRVSIIFENGGVASKSASLIGFEEATAIEPDEAVESMLSEVIANMETVLNEPVGESDIEMSSDRAPGVRTQEMPLGNLVANAYREAADTDIAIVNGGDIRADIVHGTVTRGDVVSVLPFGNTLMVKEVTPTLLREALENGVSGIVADEGGEIDHEESAQGRFPQISGFSFSYDPTAPEGGRIISITLDDGTPLSLDDETTKLTLAGSNYVMTGGDYYTMLGALPVERELGSADEALAAYIAAHSPISAIPVGRISAIPFAMEMAQAA